tara:strand:+ start:1622 stop:2029 length:408 start_codon:yes stop_codon:yes gene_type:complete
MLNITGDYSMEFTFAKATAKSFGVTEFQAEVIHAVAKMGMNANGTVKPSDLKADNVTWFNAKELVATLDSITRHQAAAVMGSLGRKGLAINSDPKSSIGWVLTDAGIDVAQQLFDSLDESTTADTTEEVAEAVAA